MYRLKDEDVGGGLKEAVKNELRGGGWPVYRRYHARPEGDEAFVVAEPSMWEPGRDLNEDLHHRYAPLRERELLLDFARLPDRGEITAEAVKEWAEVYGLLGIPGVAEMHHQYGFAPAWAARRESVARFADEAREVNGCLRLYEAAVRREGGPDRAAVEAVVGHDPVRAYQLSGTADHEVEEWAVGKVLSTVQGRLREETFWQLYRYRSGKVVGAWGFKSLLGAIWMQFSWLLESDTRVTRCKVHDCRRVVAFEPGEPWAADAPKGVRGGYKTRKDREFCKDRPCKQKYWDRKKRGKPGYV